MTGYTEVDMIGISANESIGSSKGVPNATKPDWSVPPGVYTLTWGQPCSIEFVFECSNVTISFESQGSIEIILVNCIITPDTGCVLERLPETAPLMSQRIAGYEVVSRGHRGGNGSITSHTGIN